jgi:hypothetical protein
MNDTLNLLAHARHHVEELVNDQRGENDFMPFMTVRRRDGQEAYLGMHGMEPETKDDLAAVMFGMIVAHQATEAVFASVSWMVAYPRDQVPGVLNVDLVQPSKHPDRYEAVMMEHATRDGGTCYTAKVHRRDGRVYLDEWDQLDTSNAGGGRFGDAMFAGLRMAAVLPPEMLELADEDPETAMRAAARAYKERRAAAIKKMQGQKDKPPRKEKS